MRFVIAHGHIFKNAGTTFDWSLRKNFGTGFLDHRDDKAMRQIGAAHVAELLTTLPELRAISSHHLCRPLPELEDCTIIPVFFLRHPIARIESVYQFERKQLANTRGARAAKMRSFSSYLRWRMRPDVPPTIRNYQAAYLAGMHTESSAGGHMGLPVFGRAIHAVHDSSLIGLVEHYDESMVLMEQALSEYFPDIDLSYVRQNTSSLDKTDSLDKKVAEALGKMEGAQREVLDNNSFDLVIYQLALNRHQKSVAALDDFDQRLSEFRERCAWRQSRLKA